MASSPKVQARPHVKITFELGGLAGRDWGHLYTGFEFRGMVNGGYIVRAKLVDSNYNLLNALIEEGYFKETRKKPVYVTFQIKSGDTGTYPETATRVQKAVLLSLNSKAGPSDAGLVELVAIDPPSWFLNMGDTSGKVYQGRVDQVIQKVVNDYAPKINVEVGRTTDSEFTKWWMMRQDPKTFLSSLIDWSSSITQKKTQWLVVSDGDELTIKEQGALPSKQRAFYRYFDVSAGSTITSIAIVADNALSTVQSKLITAGSSAISGQYLDMITDQSERKVFIKDAKTSNKQIARTTDDQSFSKPPDAGPEQVGWSQVTAIPEVYSAGDLGLNYDDYIDGRPRAMWLNMTNALLRIKLTVTGHGEWSSGDGLGVDTIFIKWTSAQKSKGVSNDFWWVTGNWLVYGFEHIVNRGGWATDLYCSRFDHNSDAKKVGG